MYHTSGLRGLLCNQNSAQFTQGAFALWTPTFAFHWLSLNTPLRSVPVLSKPQLMMLYGGNVLRNTGLLHYLIACSIAPPGSPSSFVLQLWLDLILPSCAHSAARNNVPVSNGNRASVERAPLKACQKVVLDLGVKLWSHGDIPI